MVAFNKQKIFLWFSIAVMFATLMMIGLLFYWILFPISVLKFNNTPFHVLTPIVKQGESLEYEVDYCKFTDKRAEVTRQFTDGIIYAMPSMTGDLTPGCHKVISTLEVPPTLPPSQYHLHISIRYDINPLHSVETEADTELFTVIKK